ncbi:autotransporter domain-containing protein [Aminobacter sp. MDW-2]|uniref:autotransporter outer membrane beta-barrel domain-containing protein n=1 Tax=Aminobacter sp. MDW-2 TaxID=2666139 RepID=UPI0012AFA2E8|nr:autotransporter domain-containing protein [Aminobacter sp. MDW-2]MRX34505.1 autotransporter domain-containing protein [Aminobacter sp. MDW-2]QNH35892.1 autotransporter domain-containing protein [Aminobacter sp. MDW-2]
MTTDHSMAKRGFLRAIAMAGMASTVLCGLAAASHAQTWEGDQSSDWFNGDNWSAGSTPAGTAVIVNQPGAPNAPSIGTPGASTSTIFIGGVTGASLDIVNGGSLTSTSAIIGNSSVNGAPPASSQTGEATVTGGSTWTTDTLDVGFYGSGTLNIAAGGSVEAAQASLATQEGSVGLVNVTGANSKWLNTGNGGTIVGDGGEGTFNVSQGASASSYVATLGQQASGHGIANVSGTDTLWQITNANLVLGQSGVGELHISGGAKVTANNRTFLGSGAGSSGTLTISGTGSALTSTVDIRIGVKSAGSVSVTAGGKLQSAAVIVGADASGVGDLIVSGSGSRVESGTYVMLGWNGDGTATVSHGGTISTAAAGIQIGFAGGSTGTLNIGAAEGDAAVAAGNIAAPKIVFGPGSGTLVFNHTDDAHDFAAAISGDGSIRHLSGTSRLLANSSSFTGTTDVLGGTLWIGDGLGGGIDVFSTARLEGSGDLGDVTIRSGAIVAPDGTFDVAGDFAFQAGSLYEVGIGGAASRIAAGTATIDATSSVNVVANGMDALSDEYLILSTSGALTGAFGGVTDDFAFLDSALDYRNASEVWLTLQFNGAAFGTVAITDNQHAVAGALDNLSAGNPMVGGLLGLSFGGARDALDQLSGDIHPSLMNAGIIASTLAQDAVQNRIRQTFDSHATAGKPSRAFWVEGVGNISELSGVDDTEGFKVKAAALFGGLDGEVAEGIRLGAMAGYSRSSISRGGQASTGTADTLHAGLYAGAELGALRLQFGAIQAWHDLSTERRVAFGGFSDSLAAGYDATTTLVHGDVGYRLGLGASYVEPFAGIAYVRTGSDGFAETGGAAALTGAAGDQDATISTLGIRASTELPAGARSVTLQGMLGWRHTDSDAPLSRLAFAGTAPFSVLGDSLASDAFVYDAGLSFAVRDNARIDVSYAGAVGDGTAAHQLRGTFAMGF